MKLPFSRFVVEGKSMEPSFKEGERVLTFNFSSPKKGDVVVVKKKINLIKRVQTIENNSYFVVGDNQNRSTDSREFGPVPKEEIVGKVLFKY